MKDDKVSINVELKDKFNKSFGILENILKDFSIFGKILKTAVNKVTESFIALNTDITNLGKVNKLAKEKLENFNTNIDTYLSSCKLNIPHNNSSSLLVAANREKDNLALSSVIGKDNAKSVQSGYVDLQKQGLGSYENIASTTHNLAISGVKTGELNKSTEAILKLSKVANMDLKSSLENLAPIAQYTNRSIKDLADILSSVQSKFSINKLDEFSITLKNIVSSTKQANLSAQDLVSTMGYFSKTFSNEELEKCLKEILDKAPKITEKLNLENVFKTDGTLDFINFLTEIEKKTQSFSSSNLEEIVSKDTLSFIKEAVKNTDDLSEAIDEVTRSYKNQLDTNYLEYAKSYDCATVKLQQSLGNLSAIFGQNMLPTMTSFTNIFANFIFAFNNFIQKNEWAAVVIGKLSSALSILKPIFSAYNEIKNFANSIIALGEIFTFLSTILTGITAAFRVFTAVLMANPIIAVITAIAMAAYLIIKNWDKLKEWFKSFFEWFENTSIYKFFKYGIDKIKSFFSKKDKIQIDSSSTESIKQNSPLLSGNTNNKVENNQQYNINVTSYASNPADVANEVMREYKKAMVGN